MQGVDSKKQSCLIKIKLVFQIPIFLPQRHPLLPVLCVLPKIVYAYKHLHVWYITYIQIYDYSSFYTSKNRICPLHLAFSQSELSKTNPIKALSHLKTSDDAFSFLPNKIPISSIANLLYSGPKL